jgi:hypothetical protein
MSQGESINLVSESGEVIPFLRKYIHYSKMMETMFQDSSTEDLNTHIPTARINKFIQFCEVMSSIDATPEKEAARAKLLTVQQQLERINQSSKRAYMELVSANRDVEAATDSTRAAAEQKAAIKTAAVQALTDEKTAVETQIKAAINEALPVPVISSGNLAAQFERLDTRYRTLLDSLIQPVGGGTINGDLLADMIQDMNFFDCGTLLNLFCGFFCLKFLNGKTADQVRTEWGIINDFTPEEQAAVTAEETWLNS